MIFSDSFWFSFGRLYISRNLSILSRLSNFWHIVVYNIFLQSLVFFVSRYFSFFYIYFNYILLIMLLQLSQFFLLCLPLPRTPNSPWHSPHLCLCPLVMHVSSLATSFPTLYLTSPWLFCNYQFALLNPLTTSPITPHAPPTWQPSKCSQYPWFCLCSSCLLSWFFRFLWSSFS